MATISELTMLMNYEDRKRARLESQERQAARDNWSQFTNMAKHNVATAEEITDQAKGETDLGVLDTLSGKLEETLTGVDFVDQLINVRANEIDLRKKTVTATNRISDHIDEFHKQLGDGITAGGKKTLEDLRVQYKNIVSQQTSDAATLQNRRLIQAGEHLNLQLWKGEFDVDKKKEGYQFPAWMGEHEKSFFTQTVEPGIRVAEASGDYTTAISQLQQAFPTMRREKTEYETAHHKRYEKEVKDDAVEQKKLQDMQRLQAFNKVGSVLNAVQGSFADLKIDNNDLPTQKVFSESLPVLSQFTESMTGENLQALDVRGAIREIDKLIIINSLQDHPDGLKQLLPSYGLDSDPLDPSMMKKVNELIAINMSKNSKGEPRYGAKYGSAIVADRGMFELIKARELFIGIASTPGMLLEEADTTGKPKGNIKLKSIK